MSFRQTFLGYFKERLTKYAGISFEKEVSKALVPNIPKSLSTIGLFLYHVWHSSPATMQVVPGKFHLGPFELDLLSSITRSPVYDHYQHYPAQKKIMKAVRTT